jgi:hypothetical protein
LVVKVVDQHGATLRQELNIMQGDRAEYTAGPRRKDLTTSPESIGATPDTLCQKAVQAIEALTVIKSYLARPGTVIVNFRTGFCTREISSNIAVNAARIVGHHKHPPSPEQRSMRMSRGYVHIYISP